MCWCDLTVGSFHACIQAVFADSRPLYIYAICLNPSNPAASACEADEMKIGSPPLTLILFSKGSSSQSPSQSHSSPLHSLSKRGDVHEKRDEFDAGM